MEKRHLALGLTDEKVKSIYRTMLLARKLDERQWLLNRAGKIPFVISCQGQEAAQVGAAYALDRERDMVMPYYRDVGVVLSFGFTARDLMLAAFAKAEDPSSGGRQMPGHFGSRRHRILSGSSPVTTQLPHAVGAALAAKMRGERMIAYTSVGDGSSNQGDFHESANFASVHKLPVIFFIENNQYAISVPLRKQVACEKLSDRAIGYGMPGVTVDGNDPLAVYEAMQIAVQRGLAGEGPTLIEAVCNRLTPHSSDDDDRTYRPREEVAAAKEKDPLPTFLNYLLQSGTITEVEEKELQAEIATEVDEATRYAEAAPYPLAESALRYVYAEKEGI
ncbi:thiamine pyrophosphate-dependent dehydrogenase E1 component subunit alpha [Rubeoparvulum massiliense]|uniref:thiamine pyrophosphate-dependent dehydrogenase E1 component subunit alpha n=1 Tax=Rubeoparvulum massiliense TaxID=1631346 RepID=UPI00065E9618|nr:thiamine pyrophosphate-dependent dehydrogenase E1 component subunit alpha [Rubeoparvulum massiliense]